MRRTAEFLAVVWVGAGLGLSIMLMAAGITRLVGS